MYGVVGLEVARTIDCTLKGEPREFGGERAMECGREDEAVSKTFA